MNDASDASDVRLLLRKARTLIADQHRWTQGYIARDAAGDPCTPRRDCARRWCAQGAVAKIAGSEIGEYLKGCSLLDLIADEMGYFDDNDIESPSAVLNDTETHDEVMTMFDRAIARAR